jgi:hypothetical protein
MAENNNNQATPTHVAYGFARQGRKFGRWLEIGTANAEENGIIKVFLDRMVYGFTGGVMLTPVGTKPPVTQPPPRRPGETDEDDPLD